MQGCAALRKPSNGDLSVGVRGKGEVSENPAGKTPFSSLWESVRGSTSPLLRKATLIQNRA